jgi:hypothetical protein
MTLNVSKFTCKTTTVKNELEDSSSSHRYFTEHLEHVEKNSTRVQQKTEKLESLIRWLKNKISF